MDSKQPAWEVAQLKFGNLPESEFKKITVSLSSPSPPWRGSPPSQSHSGTELPGAESPPQPESPSNLCKHVQSGALTGIKEHNLDELKDDATANRDIIPVKGVNEEGPTSRPSQPWSGSPSNASPPWPGSPRNPSAAHLGSSPNKSPLQSGAPPKLSTPVQTGAKAITQEESFDVLKDAATVDRTSDFVDVRGVCEQERVSQPGTKGLIDFIPPVQNKLIVDPLEGGLSTVDLMSLLPVRKMVDPHLEHGPGLSADNISRFIKTLNQVFSKFKINLSDTNMQVIKGIYEGFDEINKHQELLVLWWLPDNIIEKYISWLNEQISKCGNTPDENIQERKEKWKLALCKFRKFKTVLGWLSGNTLDEGMKTVVQVISQLNMPGKKVDEDIKALEEIVSALRKIKRFVQRRLSENITDGYAETSKPVIHAMELCEMLILGFRRGCLSDRVIVKYLLCLKDLHKDKNVCIKYLKSLKEILQVENVNKWDWIFGVWNPSGRHWILVVVDMKKKLYVHLDSAKSEPPEEVDLPDYERDVREYRLQKDDNSCGVYVCWYAKQLLTGQPLMEEMNPDYMRSEIYQTLRGGCLQRFVFGST